MLDEYKKINFVTLFPRAENVHFFKDVGMVGASLAQNGFCSAQIASFAQGPVILPEGLEFIKIPGHGYKPRRPSFWVLKWLYNNKHNIDILHLFHFNFETITYACFMKCISPKSKLYIKLDLDPTEFENLHLSPKSFWNFIGKIEAVFRKKVLRKVDVISVETKGAMQRFSKYDPEISPKLILMPNGIDPNFIKGIEFASFNNIEKRILLVGRLGTYQKNTEQFFEALAMLNCYEWQISLVGSVEEDFKNWFKLWLVKNPNWVNSIHFVGLINNRSELGNLMAKSAIFVLPSRYESFGLVLVEAISAGCFCIASNIPTSVDIIESSDYGVLYDKESTNDLTLKLKTSIEQNIWKSGWEKRRAYAKNLAWNSVVENLQKALS